MRYIALLRGINVGGNAKVDMKRLKTTFESVGLYDVRTYINSGNILFSDTKHTKKALTILLEKAIRHDFQLVVKVLIRTAREIHTTTQALPTSWVNDQTMKCDVMFLWEEFDNPKVLDTLPIKEVDEVKYIPGAVLWRVDRSHVTKSGIMKLVGTKLYKGMTIRNCNTVRKLNELISS